MTLGENRYTVLIKINPKYEVLILGMGNPLRSDDGAGLYVFEMLRQKQWPPGVRLAEAGTSILYFFEEISSSRSVIAIDAVRAGGGPGNIYRLTVTDLIRHPDGWRDAHRFSLPDAVELAGRLTGRSPELVVIGIEPAVLTFGHKLSPAVQAVLPKAVDAVEKEAARLGAVYDGGLVGQSG